MDHKRIAKWTYGLALIALVATMLLPVYNIRPLNDQYSQVSYEFYPYGVDVGDSFLESDGFAWITEDSQYYGSMIRPLIAYMLLTVVAAITLSAKLVVDRRRGKKGLWPQNDTLTGVAITCSALVPLLFYITGASAMLNRGFWGSDESMNLAWGPEIGWYLSFVPIALIIIGLVSTSKIDRAQRADEPLVTEPTSSSIQLPLVNVKEEAEKPAGEYQKPAEAASGAVAPVLLCGRCGDSISADAARCPHCGVEVKKL